jgi:hypothetical protein
MVSLHLGSAIWMVSLHLGLRLGFLLLGLCFILDKSFNLACFEDATFEAIHILGVNSPIVGFSKVSVSSLDEIFLR